MHGETIKVNWNLFRPHSLFTPFLSFSSNWASYMAIVPIYGACIWVSLTLPFSTFLCYSFLIISNCLSSSCHFQSQFFFFLVRHIVHNVNIHNVLQHNHCCIGEKNNNYYIFRVCVCSPSYPACKAHASYCHLCPVWLYNISFPLYLTNGTTFGKNVAEHKTATFVSNIAHSKQKR